MVSLACVETRESGEMTAVCAALELLERRESLAITV